ncbi:MAG: HEAT repeat domain-containing protein [Chloroflexota bacterium]
MRPSVTELFWQLETGQESMQEDAIEAIAALSYQLHAHSSNLIKQLKHNSPHVRRLTAHTLGIILCREAVDPLIQRAIHDRDDDVRMEAFHALGRLRDRRAVEPLSRLLLRRNTPSEDLRAAIIAALGAIGDERAMVPLLAQLNTSNERLRRITTQAIEELMGEKAALALWRELEKEPSPRSRVWEFLLGMPVEPSNTIIDAIRSDDPDMMFEDVTFFADLEARSRAKSLLAGLFPEVPTDARIMVLQMIADMGDTKAVGPVAQLLYDPTTAIRVQALHTLARIGDPAAVPHITGMLEGERWDTVVMEAVIALAHLRDRRAVEILYRVQGWYANSDNDDLRFAIWLAIDRLCSDDELFP